MCGISGIIDQRRHPDDVRSEVDKMITSLHHRGPDANGIYQKDGICLGHNRLSIIDISQDANQPMHFDDFVIVYNGEIYNYLELKDELIELGHKFTTASDTEVILHSYNEWGEECVNRFIGMWAFTIINKSTSEVFISRDRFGIKPLYYICKDDSFVFASEIKALKHTSYFNAALNPAQVARYLQLGWIQYYDETFFENVNILPAAHNLTIKGGNINIYQYWDLDTGSIISMEYHDLVDIFRMKFADSVRLHLRSDVPIATCLSGGIDSSSIVAMVCNINPDIHYKTFSIYYTGKDDVDERPFALKVNDMYPQTIPNYYEPKFDEVKSEFERALYHQDVPPSSSSFISQYFLMKAISEQNIKVVLDGQGGDEYLAGYNHSFYRLSADHFRSFGFLKAFNELYINNKSRGSGLKGFMSETSKSLLSLIFSEDKLYDLEYRYYHPKATNYNGPKPFVLKNVRGSKLDNFLYHLLFTTSLPNLLHYEDRNSMAFSVESRVPFLDHRLIEFAFSLSNDCKISKGITKRILRDALKDILPAEIYSRKDKKGFVTPGAEKWGGLFEMSLRLNKNIVLLNKNIFIDSSKVLIPWRMSCIKYWLNY